MRFIAIVRETGKGSRPHEELALKLEEEYGRLINDPGGRGYDRAAFLSNLLS